MFVFLPPLVTTITVVHVFVGQNWNGFASSTIGTAIAASASVAAAVRGTVKGTRTATSWKKNIVIATLE